MLYFLNDYSEGGHPKILEALIQSNMEKHVGYGLDQRSRDAKDLIKKLIKKPEADVHLLVAGTQTNTIAISAFLRPYEAVISTNLGHIAVHETGAIEATGHKIIEMESHDGLLKPEQIEQACRSHKGEHMVVPKLVYLSNATEMGTIYTKQKLLAIRKVCDDNGLYLYIDGARLSTALSCRENDLSLEVLADLADAFYIGGTKNGLLFGEALVICNSNLQSHLRYTIKQRGGMLAKGRLLGVQFEALLKDGLYLDIAKHTNAMASRLREGLEGLGYRFVTESPTNLLFLILPNPIHAKLSKVCHYEVEKPYDENHVEARFVTSWATTAEDVDRLIAYMKEYKD